MGPDAMILVFWMLSFKAAFSLSFLTLFRRLFSSSTFLPIRVVSFAYLKLLIFLPVTFILACFIQHGILHDAQEAGKVVWYSHLFMKFLQFVVMHTVKGFCVVSEAELDFFCFWNSFAFSMIPWMLAIWSLVSSSLAFCMMYSGYKLNKQDDCIQPWSTPFPVLNQSVVPHPFLTVASLPACKFVKRPVRWSGIPISLWIFHSFLWST